MTNALLGRNVRHEQPVRFANVLTSDGAVNNTTPSFEDMCHDASVTIERATNSLMEMLCTSCSKPARSRVQAPVGTTTKLTCLTRLARLSYPLFAEGDVELLTAAKRWCYSYGCLTLGRVASTLSASEADERARLARRGMALAQGMLRLERRVRERKNRIGEAPAMPEQVGMQCLCMYRCVKG